MGYIRVLEEKQIEKDVPTVCIVVRMVSHAQMQIIVGSLWYLLMVAGRVNGIG